MAATISLPTFRSDVVFSEHRSTDERRFVVKDPRSGRFFQLGEVEHFIGQQLDGRTSLEEVCRRTEERFEAELGIDAVRRLVEHMADLGLLECEQASASSPARRVRGNLLYLRFPAFDPDRLLSRLERGTRWLFAPQTVVGCGLLAAFAAWLWLTSPGLLAGGVARLQGFETLVAVWITLLAVTVIHEFAHGLTCKHFGGQVREMGFMLIYFQPALYCNVSDAWLFPEKSRRLWVTFAGAFAEIAIWALATLFFHASDPSSGLHVLAWTVMATSGIKTLFNLNPLIKLDGYYLLSDALEIPNLRARAFGYLRSLWIGAGPGGDAPSARERRVYVIYGILSALFSCWLLLWVGRWIGGWLLERFHGLGFLLFVGILFMMFGSRLRSWWGTARAALARGEGSGNGRGRRRRVLAALACGILLFVVLGRGELTVLGDFSVSPLHNHDVRAEVPGIIEQVLVAEGDAVDRGQLLVVLSDRDLRAELEQVRAELAEQRARHRLLVAGARAEEIALAEAAVAKASERLRYARHQLQRLESLYSEQLSSLKDYDEAREAAAVRARELEEARGELELLRAGARSEEIEALAAEVARLETRAAHLEDRLARVRIASPIAGIVTTPKLEERIGEQVEVGDLVLEVHDLATVNVEIAVPEDEISEVRIGQPVRLRARAFPGRELTGGVAAIAPTARESENEWEPRTVTVTTRVENPGGDLKPRMTGSAKIVCGEHSILELATRRVARSVGLEVWTWW